MRIQCLSGCHCKKLNLTCNYASPWSTRLWLYSVMGGRENEGGERRRGEGRKERAERREGKGTKKGGNVIAVIVSTPCRLHCLKWDVSVSVTMVNNVYPWKWCYIFPLGCYLSKCILQNKVRTTIADSLDFTMPYAAASFSWLQV